MTTGERLVEISTLTTGTAEEHLLNVEFGGSGECPPGPFDMWYNYSVTGEVKQHSISGRVKRKIN